MQKYRSDTQSDLKGKGVITHMQVRELLLLVSYLVAGHGWMHRLEQVSSFLWYPITLYPYV